MRHFLGLCFMVCLCSHIHILIHEACLLVWLLPWRGCLWNCRWLIENQANSGKKARPRVVKPLRWETTPYHCACANPNSVTPQVAIMERPTLPSAGEDGGKRLAPLPAGGNVSAVSECGFYWCSTDTKPTRGPSSLTPRGKRKRSECPWS